MGIMGTVIVVTQSQENDTKPILHIETLSNNNRDKAELQIFIQKNSHYPDYSTKQLHNKFNHTIPRADF